MQSINQSINQSFNSGNDRTHLEIQYNRIKWLKYIEKYCIIVDMTLKYTILQRVINL